MSKFNSSKITIDGKTFDSKKEARRYTELKLLERAGEIAGLRTQVAYELAPRVRFASEERAKPAVRYMADFVYLQNGVTVVEDVKSPATRSLPVYRLKKHLMMSVHGLEVSEV